MRKITALLSACLLLACLFACGQARPALASTTDITTTQTTTEITTTQTTTEITTTETTTETTTTTIPPPTTTQKTTTEKQSAENKFTTLQEPIVPRQFVGSAKSGPLY